MLDDDWEPVVEVDEYYANLGWSSDEEEPGTSDKRGRAQQDTLFSMKFQSLQDQMEEVCRHL